MIPKDCSQHAKTYQGLLIACENMSRTTDITSTSTAQYRVACNSRILLGGKKERKKETPPETVEFVTNGVFIALCVCAVSFSLFVRQYCHHSWDSPKSMKLHVPSMQISQFYLSADSSPTQSQCTCNIVITTHAEAPSAAQRQPCNQQHEVVRWVNTNSSTMQKASLGHRSDDPACRHAVRTTERELSDATKINAG